ncbi:hypothetical protein [Mongoliibacter ruber]|uniref:Uncharacterized protein n=1 Tax=Mongoliibacter ruber TaxID=1750599 RepID=A0A2T0WHU1_9BACT|nr:hypothetical protein [Mongoliibacter ruber]PRY86283.1 hypothetical protein CLW00_109130 [Mongoliibacter ruber]
MSDNCLHIVPIHEGDYPNASQKAEEILQWFIEKDIVENELSDCTLSSQQGYRFKPAIADLFKDGEIWAYSKSLKTHGLEITSGTTRKVFHPMEGMYLEIHCPHCKNEIDEETAFSWVGNWAKGQNTFQCTHCQNKAHLVRYTIEPEWGFSNIGITLWNAHWDAKPAFINVMEHLFECPVILIQVRI